MCCDGWGGKIFFNTRNEASSAVYILQENGGEGGNTFFPAGVLEFCIAVRLVGGIPFFTSRWL